MLWIFLDFGILWIFLDFGILRMLFYIEEFMDIDVMGTLLHSTKQNTTTF